MKRVILGSALVLVGVLLALQPLDWIEQRYDVDPDADSGVLEFIVSAALVTAGAILVGSVWWARGFAVRGRRRNAASRRGPQVAKWGE